MYESPKTPFISTDHRPPFFDVRTDLAVEETEKRREEGSPAFPGVTIQEFSEHEEQVHVTRVVIENEAGAQALGKSVGTYITLDTASMDQNDGESHRQISQVLADQLNQLLQPLCPDGPPSILAVGLGNADVTPDALGPRVLGNLLITRHLTTGQFASPTFSTDSASVCGIVPGVMAQTGMETAEIVKALADQIHPDMVLVIDALAARSVSRLGTTIQLTDTGIRPGSGVGNHRHSLTQESLGVPVIAIGVPTVVGAAAIVTDTLDALIDALRQETHTQSVADTLHHMNSDEKYALIRELLEPRFGPMFVTPKDIDETVKRISFTISEGINMALFGEQPA
ncbi:MAG: GPR endopeptidase [Lachnospiraceae bacterium]|nr:GPR endopeptidase [Lachnospiraceae bacterium]